VLPTRHRAITHVADGVRRQPSEARMTNSPLRVFMDTWLVVRVDYFSVITIIKLRC
jgi:hypothetical protein